MSSMTRSPESAHWALIVIPNEVRNPFQSYT